MGNTMVYMKKRLYPVSLAVTSLLVLSILFLLAACATNPVTGSPQLMLLSEDQEIELGRQTDSQVVKDYGIYDDDQVLSAYIEHVGQRLGHLSHRPGLSYQFKILDTPVVNAFAVPGGWVYFTRGILACLNSEAELAGVIGHEIGHITARHSAQQYSRAQLAQIGLGLGVILSERFQGVAGLAQFGVGMLFLSFSRDDERQADDLGVEYSSKAGYDATRMAQFFQTLERLHPTPGKSGLPEWFSTHPNPADRIGAIQRKAKEWQKELDLKGFEVNRKEYLHHINGLVFGEDPREGFIENNVFYHPVLRFRFPVPANWKVQNTRSLVRMTSANKDATLMFMLSPDRSHESASQDFLRTSGATLVDSAGEKINGFPAVRLNSTLRSRQGTLYIMSCFIQKGRTVYVFHGVSSRSQFKGYTSIFQDSMENFKTLIDPKKLNVQPDRIRIVPTSVAGTMRQVLRAAGIPEENQEKWAIMNGKTLSDHVPANTLIKIVKKGTF